MEIHQIFQSIQNFSFYGWVWFWEHGEKTAKLGCLFGVNRHVGKALSLYILKANDKIITCTTVQRVTSDDALLPAIQKLMAKFDSNVVGRLDSKLLTIEIDKEISTKYHMYT